MSYFHDSQDYAGGYITPRRNPQGYRIDKPPAYTNTMRPEPSRRDLVHLQQHDQRPHEQVAHAMKSYLHGDYGDTVLFKNWVLKNEWDTALTCIAFLLLALLVEGLKCYREHLYKRLSFAVERQVPVPPQGHHLSSHRSQAHSQSDKESQSSGHLLTTGKARKLSIDF